MTMDEFLVARRRFDADQEDAEYVEYTFAMGRIGNPRKWQRERRRFLLARGCAPG
jgi:hypothetical protein